MAYNNPLCSYNKYMQHHIMELFSDSKRFFELVLRLAEKNKDMSLSKLQGAYGQDKNVTLDFYTKLLGSKSKFMSMLVAHILCGIGLKDLENFHESRQLPVTNVNVEMRLLPRTMTRTMIKRPARLNTCVRGFFS